MIKTLKIDFKKIIFILVSVLFLTVLVEKNASAQTYTWQNAVIMGGGFVAGVDYSPVSQELIGLRPLT